jgi:chitinase
LLFPLPFIFLLDSLVLSLLVLFNKKMETKDPCSVSNNALYSKLRDYLFIGNNIDSFYRSTNHYERKELIEEHLENSKKLVERPKGEVNMKLGKISIPTKKFKMYFALVLLMIFTFNIHPVYAAKLDKTPPTAPTSLRATEITDTSISLAWNASTDNVGVTGYQIYRNNSLITTVTSQTYTFKNLTPATTYQFIVKARDARGNVSGSSNTLSVATKAASVDAPPIVSPISVSPIGSDGQTISGTVNLSVTASDDKGISKVEFYSSNGGYLIRSVTSAPYSTSWATDPWVPDGQQILKAVVYDTSNQVAQVTKTVMVKNAATVPAPIETEYKKVGYYSSWSTYSNFQVSNIDASQLTHINYAFANISPTGEVVLGDSWADVEKPFPGDSTTQPIKGNFNQLIKLKQQYPHLKTLISIGGWTWSDRFSDVALTEQSRTIFANSAVQFMTKYGFDGIDIDWEYPVSGGETGNIERPEDKQNFTLLLKALREALNVQSSKDGKQYLLSIAAGAGKTHAGNLELNSIHQYVDYIQLMTYDIHGSWDSITGFNAPLYRDPGSRFSWDWSVNDAVLTYINGGVPAQKLIMGLPLYGRAYNQVTNIDNGLYQSYSGGGSAIGYGELLSKYIGLNGYTRFWDGDSKVPWLFNGSQFISYDDEESIGYKTSYIKSMRLGGAMMWELSNDPNKKLLTKIDTDL